jgi:hypothetical protein
MVDRISIVREFGKCLVKCFQGGLCVGAFAAVIADDLVRVQIHDQGQVFKVLPGPDVGDIRDPDLIGGGCFEFGDQIPIHRQCVT